MSEIANNNANFLLGPAKAGSSAERVDTTVNTQASAQTTTLPAAAAAAAAPRVQTSLTEAEQQAGFGSPVATLFGVGRRHVLATSLGACYVLFYTALYASSSIDAPAGLVTAMFVCWVVGFLAILFGVRDIPQLNLTAARLDVMLAIWGNAGVVASATLVGGEMRLLLLVGVIFGVLYSGLHFREPRVRTVLLATLFSYLGCVILNASFVPVSLEFELLCAIGLAVLLLASSAIAREIIRLRMHSRVRNRQLAEALRRVEELALRDELTGLYNRRHLLDFVDRAIATRERGGPSFALAYCDLDHFKRVNDRFGHECGDRLLSAFAEAALGSVRNNDLVARIGGEEFVLVLVDTDEANASDIVERLRMRTANIKVSSAEPAYQVTVSVGLATHNEDDTVSRILRRADGALYEAKEQGRDRLITA